MMKVPYWTRISGTVRLNVRCRVGAARRGIADRLMPVIQGWKAGHYLRCIDRMPFVLDAPLVGVGSMCRRHVQGENGILRIVDELDRAFAGTDVRLQSLRSEIRRDGGCSWPFAHR